MFLKLYIFPILRLIVFDWKSFTVADSILTLLVPILQNGQTHSICWQFADELFECVWPSCGIGA